MPILDCHVHVNNYDRINGPEDKSLSLEERVNSLLKSMDINNIDYSLILSSYRVDADRPSTSQIIEAIKKYDTKNYSRLGVVAGFTIDNHTLQDLDNCRKWLKDGLIKGVKIYCGYEHYYPYDEKYQGVYDLCVEYESPLMIHTGDTFSNTAKIKYSHPLNVDDIAVDNPELKIIMCHLGNPWLTDCQEILYKNRNVYSDISGLVVGNFTSYTEAYYINKIKELLNYVGEPNRLLYGSDWPISSMSSCLSFVQKLDLNEDSHDLLMFRNTKRLFRL